MLDTSINLITVNSFILCVSTVFIMLCISARLCVRSLKVLILSIVNASSYCFVVGLTMWEINESGSQNQFGPRSVIDCKVVW